MYVLQYGHKEKAAVIQLYAVIKWLIIPYIEIVIMCNASAGKQRAEKYMLKFSTLVQLHKDVFF